MKNQRRNGEEKSRFKSKEASTREKKGKGWKKNQIEQRKHIVERRKKMNFR
jgi:hypothetical protein